MKSQNYFALFFVFAILLFIYNTTNYIILNFKNMMKLLGLIMKRPSDIQICYAKIMLGTILMLIWSIAFWIQWLQFEESFLGMELTKIRQLYLSHFIVFFGSIVIVLWGLDVHFLSRGYTRILQILFGVFLILLSGVFKETPTLNVGVIYFLLWLIVIFVGITGKFITKQGLRAGQKITKIRV